MRKKNLEKIGGGPVKKTPCSINTVPFHSLMKNHFPPKIVIICNVLNPPPSKVIKYYLHSPQRYPRYGACPRHVTLHYLRQPPGGGQMCERPPGRVVRDDVEVERVPPVEEDRLEEDDHGAARVDTCKHLYPGPSLTVPVPPAQTMATCTDWQSAPLGQALLTLSWLGSRAMSPLATR